MHPFSTTPIQVPTHTLFIRSHHHLCLGDIHPYHVTTFSVHEEGDTDLYGEHVIPVKTDERLVNIDVFRRLLERDILTATHRDLSARSLDAIASGLDGQLFNDYTVLPVEHYNGGLGKDMLPLPPMVHGSPL